MRNSEHIPLYQHERAPKTIGAYLLYHVDDHLVYAGKGKLRTRLSKHFGKISWSRLDENDYVFVYFECDMEVAVSIEQHIIAKAEPEWNSMGFGSNAQGCRRNQNPSEWDIQFGPLKNPNIGHNGGPVWIPEFGF